MNKILGWFAGLSIVGAVIAFLAFWIGLAIAWIKVAWWVLFVWQW